MSGITVTTYRSLSHHLIYHYLPAGAENITSNTNFSLLTSGLLCLLSLLGLVLPLHMSSIRIGLLTIILLLISCIIRFDEITGNVTLRSYYSSVKSQLPFYSSPSFLEIYLSLLLMLVSMLFIQTFYLILR